MVDATQGEIIASWHGESILVNPILAFRGIRTNRISPLSNYTPAEPAQPEVAAAVPKD
jgi:hypothetical protein